MFCKIVLPPFVRLNYNQLKTKIIIIIIIIIIKSLITRLITNVSSAILGFIVIICKQHITPPHQNGSGKFPNYSPSLHFLCVRVMSKLHLTNKEVWDKKNSNCLNRNLFCCQLKNAFLQAMSSAFEMNDHNENDKLINKNRIK
jgi:hypothetical protein